MPTLLPIPKTAELMETIRTTQQLIEKYPGRCWLVQPKYDGSKCVLIPTDAGYVACTANGNKIECIPDVLRKMDEVFGGLPVAAQPVFETEIEPDPWTPENKVKLNGNLYKAGGLTFGIQLSAFDCISKHDFDHQSEKGMPFSERAAALLEYAGMLQMCGVGISPTVELTTEQVAKHFDDGLARGKASHRVYFDPIPSVRPVEGFVIRDPAAPYIGGRRNSTAIKLKPFVSLDLVVVAAGTKKNGMAALGCVDIKDIASSYCIFTGLPKEMRSDPAAMIGKVIEIEVLTTDDHAKNVGNPTYKNERPDKSFDIDRIPSKMVDAIKKKLVAADIDLVELAPDMDMG